MACIQALVLRIGTILFRIRTGTLALVSLVSILKNNALIVCQGIYGATLNIWSACLSCVSKYIKRSVKVGVVTMKTQDSIQGQENG